PPVGRPPAPAPPAAAPGPGPTPPGRRTLGSVRGSAAAVAPANPPATPPPPPPAEAAATPPPTVPAPTGAVVDDLPTRDHLTKAWGDEVLGRLRGRTRALYASGRFLAVEDGRAVFALPDPAHRDQCRPLQADVEAALAAHFGRPVPLRLVADGGPVGGRAADLVDDDPGSMDDLRDAPAQVASSPADRVKSAFPGAEEVQP
ncbi:MAG TPA: hypothetical protein VM933_11610, partial [Acidimicrobiales bacterium]|nr:hypothetical protein [Acidimicrobiales bacterium]